MRNFLLAVSLLTSLVATATPAQAVRTWEGVSVAVPNDETGASEFYTVRFTLDDSAALYAPIPLIAQNPPFFTPYFINLYNNVTSISVSGPRPEASATVTGGVSRVSTLAPNLSQAGANPYSIFAGPGDDFTPGLAFQFLYYPSTGYSSTAMPGSLDIPSSTFGAPGTTYAGFNLVSYDYEGDPADENIQPTQLLNFFLASGGFLPSATDVPEPATWGMMILGFGMVGASLRRRRMAVSLG